jgi:HlyD family secretion protein
VAEAESALAVTEATLVEAQSEYERLLAGPTQAEINAYEAQIEAAQASLDVVSITAPFDGVITQTHFLSGDVVQAGDLALRMDDLSSFTIEINIHEVDIQQIEIGQTVSIVFDALEGEEYSGRVIEVGDYGEENASGIVWFQVVVEVLDADTELFVGMSATVAFQVFQAEDALLVPNQAISIQDGTAYVYVSVPNGEIEEREVEIGAISVRYSEITSGNLNEGELVIQNPEDFGSTD